MTKATLVPKRITIDIYKAANYPLMEEDGDAVNLGRLQGMSCEWRIYYDYRDAKYIAWLAPTDGPLSFLKSITEYRGVEMEGTNAHAYKALMDYVVEDIFEQYGLEDNG